MKQNESLIMQFLAERQVIFVAKPGSAGKFEKFADLARDQLAQVNKKNMIG